MNRREFLGVAGKSLAALALPRMAISQSPWKDAVLYRHDTRWPVVSLTIDDGFTLSHLETATNLCIKYGFDATFFLNGHGLDVFRYNNSMINPLTDKWHEAGFSFAYHSQFHLWENINWSRKQWQKDYEQWMGRAWRSFGGKVFFAHLKYFARAPFGAFYDPFLEMCEDNNLIPYGWSSDPQNWARNIKPKSGDIVLLHARPQDWHQFKWLSENWHEPVVSLPKLRQLEKLTKAGFGYIPRSFYTDTKGIENG